MKVIYKDETGGVNILIPTPQALEFFTIEQIAEKDVPHNVPYIIVADDSLIENLTSNERYSMEWDDTAIPDGFGGINNEFDAQLLEEYFGGSNV